MQPSHQNEMIPSTLSILLGAHLSISGGLSKAVYRARDLKCTALQLFTKNASTWKERDLSTTDISEYKAAVGKTGIAHMATHTSYLINLASPDRSKYLKSKHALACELQRASLLGIPHVVMHPGAHMGCGESEGIRRLTDGINQVFHTMADTRTRLLLETTAGQGTSLGHRFEQIAEMLQAIDCQERIGVCIDTAHIFAAGYDIRNQIAYIQTMADFEKIIGIHHLHLFHLNDSKKNIGSRVDRHEHIGMGSIGIECFKLIMNDRRFRTVPKIIETPKSGNRKSWDRQNLNRLLSLVV
jgi:deoxyribonuclease-4